MNGEEEPAASSSCWASEMLLASLFLGSIPSGEMGPTTPPGLEDKSAASGMQCFLCFPRVYVLVCVSGREQ